LLARDEAELWMLAGAKGLSAVVAVCAPWLGAWYSDILVSHGGDSFVYRRVTIFQTVNPQGLGWWRVSWVCGGGVCVTWLFWPFFLLNAMICSSPAYSRKKTKFWSCFHSLSTKYWLWVHDNII
jgi:hypothetical protein